MGWRHLAAGLVITVGLWAPSAGFSSPAFAQAATTESTLDKIKARGKLLVGCVPDLPYAGEDPRSGKWRGYVPLMADDMAKRLKVEWECVPVTWSSAVLALQTGKVDIVLDLGATPERAQVANFVGPSNRQPFMMVTRKGLAGATWEDFNKPEIRVAVQTGTSNEMILDRFAPKATKISLAPGTDPSLAVSSGRADAFLSTFLSGTIAHAKNPGIGDLVLPTPLVSADSYIGFRYENDRRWEGFVRAWLAWNAKIDSVKTWVTQGLVDSGVPAGNLPELMRKAGY